MTQFVAFSGGKDSTAMVERMAELGEDFTCLFTPTGNELPDLAEHIAVTVKRIRRSLVIPENKSLEAWIHFHNALPNFRMRWCTRQIKIEPCIAHLVKHPGSTLCVGLRADEEDREGLYGPYATYRYPLREWGWGLRETWKYLRDKGISIPKRTDCAWCYDQRLNEWYDLWRSYPEIYAQGEYYEMQTGHTFRSAQRDSWPAPLKDLRVKFEAGHKPRGVDDQMALDFMPETAKCRVCRL